MSSNWMTSRLYLAAFIAAAVAVGPAQAAEEKTALQKFSEQIEALIRGEKVNLQGELSKLGKSLKFRDRTLLIRANGTAKRQIPPDQVTFQVKISGFGANVGAVIAGLNAQKKALLATEQDAGVTVKNAQVASLDVR